MTTSYVTLGGARAVTIIHAAQGESEAQQFVFDLIDRHGVSVEIPDGAMAYLHIDKAGDPVVVEGVVEGDNVFVVLPYQATTRAGDNKCTLQIVSEEEDFRTENFTLRVSPNHIDGLVSDRDFGPLTSLIYGAKGILENIRETTVLLDNITHRFLEEPELLEQYQGSVVNAGGLTINESEIMFYAGDRDNKIFRDEEKTVSQISLPATFSVCAMASNGNTLAVLGNDRVCMTKSGGTSWELNTSIASAWSNQWVALKPIGVGFVAIPDWTESGIALFYGEDIDGHSEWRNLGYYGNAVYDIAEGNGRIIEAVNAGEGGALRITTGDVKTGSWEIQPMPNWKIPFKIAFDGVGFQIICTDGTTAYYSAPWTTVRITGRIEQFRVGSTDMVTAGPVCVCSNGAGKIYYAKPGEAWKTIDAAGYFERAAAYGDQIRFMDATGKIYRYALTMTGQSFILDEYGEALRLLQIEHERCLDILARAGEVNAALENVHLVVEQYNGLISRLENMIDESGIAEILMEQMDRKYIEYDRRLSWIENHLFEGFVDAARVDFAHNYNGAQVLEGWVNPDLGVLSC